MRGSWAMAVAVLVAGCGGKPHDTGNEMGAGTQDTAMMAMGAGGVEYTVILKSRWTRANFPYEYPEAGVVSGPHFSGLIGATHHAGYDIFAEGQAPTPGLERLSEEGKHTPLDSEIRAAQAAGSAGALFESGPLRDFSDSLVATFSADPQHPMVSVVAMIAPSPDWFTGVRAVNLMENGQWVANRTIDLYAYDSGGDDGTTYKAADQDTNPKKPTMKAATPHFVVNGSARAVGSITFVRK
jgi:hypothetical protein